MKTIGSMLKQAAVMMLVLACPTMTMADGGRMSELDWLVGEWQGEGWIRKGPGEPHRFRSHERVERKLDGRILAIHGRHFDAGTDALVHDAFAVISAREDGYRFTSWLADGRSGDFAGWVEDGAFHWEMSIPDGGRIRYTLRGDAETWDEVGRMTSDGENWHDIFAMKLRKVSQ